MYTQSHMDIFRGAMKHFAHVNTTVDAPGSFFPVTTFSQVNMYPAASQPLEISQLFSSPENVLVS